MGKPCSQEASGSLAIKIQYLAWQLVLFVPSSTACPPLGEGEEEEIRMGGDDVTGRLVI
jgi:hypothetical protein